MAADLEPLLDPASIAVVGASPDSWYSSRLMNNLLDYGFDGPVYPVNPGRAEAWGRTCYDGIEDVPEVVDLVVVSVPREVAVDVVRTAADRGIPAALVITAGFAEADDRGRELQTELAEIAADTGIRVAGPNCIGLANMRSGTVLTSTCSRQPTPGNIALVSQSGALAFTTFYERATDEDIHFSHIVSTGNEADLGLADYVEYFAADPAVDVICTYIEGVDDPRRFVRVAAEAVRAGTPVLTVKVGRSATAEAATLSHTGSLTGDDEVWDAALESAGVERVSDIPDLISSASAVSAYEPPASDRVCVLSTSGGLASLLADFASMHDLALPALAPETEQALIDMEGLLTFGELPNPVDIRGYGAEILPEIADVVFADDNFDAYLLAIGLSGVDDRAARVAADIETIFQRADAPVFVLWTGRKEPGDLPDPQPFERLREHVPLFYDPERCVEALATLAAAREKPEAVTVPSTRPEQLEDGSYRAHTVLTWTEATGLLGAAGISPVESTVVTDPESAAEAAAAIGFPVVMKVDSRDVPHRKEVGGLVLDIATPDAAASAYATITDQVATTVHGASINGVVVQPTIEAGVEVLLGTRHDPGFGPVVTVGSGGTLVEQFDDRSMRLAPIDRAQAEAMLAETSLATRLTEAERSAVIDLLVRVSDLVTSHPIDELDLNPVIVSEGDCAIVDALIRTR